MKKIFINFLSLLIIFTLVACSSGSSNEAQNDVSNEKNIKSTESNGESTAEDHKIAHEKLVLNMGSPNDFKYGPQDSLSLITDFMVGLDEDFNPVPNLIESWEISDDAKEYTLKLREDVKFQDGSNFNAEACKYDLENLGSLYYSGYIYSLDNIEILDEYSLKVKFKNSNIHFLSELNKIPAFPIDCLDENKKIKNYTGTGAFILKDYKQDEEAHLIRNDEYWNKDKMPLISEIKWFVIPDAKARSLALESGEVDIIGFSEHGKSLDQANISKFKNNNKFSIVSENEKLYTSVLSINPNYTKMPFNDLNFRKSLEYAIDREEILETVYFGEGIAMGHMMNPNFADCSEKVVPFVYDMKKAKQILEEGGYILENDILTKDGKPIKIEILSLTDPQYSDLATYLVTALKKLGIEASIKSVDYSAFTENGKSKDYDLQLMMRWFEPTFNHLSFLGLQADDQMGYGLGYGINAEMIDAGNRIIFAENEQELRAASDDFWKINYDLCSSIPVYASYRKAIYNNEWQGFNYNPNYFVIDLSGVSKK